MNIASKTKAYILVLAVVVSAQPVQGAWLKIYSPTRGITSVDRHRSQKADYYLSGLKFSREFIAKLDAKGHFRWGKLILSPIHIDHTPLNSRPPFGYMYASKDNAIPFIWGKLNQNDENGGIKRNFTKSFANALSGKFQLTPVTNGQARTKEYFITGSINSAIRNGSNVQGSDIVVAKINLVDGSFYWQHVLGFDLGGLIPTSDANFPRITKSLGNYFLSRTMTLANPSTGHQTTYTIVAKLSGVNGGLMGSPIMIDNMIGTHTSLKDASVIIDVNISEVNNPRVPVIIKLDNDLNLLWAKSYADPNVNNIFTYFGTNGLEVADGTLEVTGGLFFPRAQMPIIMHVNTKDGSIGTQKILPLSTPYASSRLSTFYNDNNTPASFDWFSGSTINNILYGKLDGNLSPLWVKSINKGVVDFTVGGSISIQPHNNANAYSLSGLNPIYDESKMLFGVLNGNGNVPDCSAIKDSVLDLVTLGITATDISSSVSIHPTTVLTDFGTLPTTVINYKKSKFKTKEMKWREAVICE